MARKTHKTLNIFINEKPDFHIDLGNLLRVPANIYWKNCDGIHLGCNDYAAEDTGLTTPKDYIGMSIFDISSPENAKIIDKIDKNIIKTAAPNCIIESSGSLLSEAGSYFSLKSPLFHSDHTIAGLFGISFRLNANNFVSVSYSLNSIQLENGLNLVSTALLKHHAAKFLFDSAKLSPKEEKILFHLCCGKSSKEIARIFNISKRTVETHIEHIKFKTGCATKYQLIDKFAILNSIK